MKFQKEINYGKQYLSKKCISSVLETLNSDFLTQGPTIKKFENAFSSYVNAKFALSVNSGTAALHLSCLALGLNKDDVLWTVPNSFVASANCALYCGARVDFIDIDPLTWNLSISKLKEKLELAKLKGSLPKIIVLVHFSGFPCDLIEIHKLSKKFGFYIIEDACHALGSVYKGNKIGSCKYSDITTFSFHPVKAITTGEGGMIVTNKKTIYEKIKLLRSHGITKDPKKMLFGKKGPWYYEQKLLGYNYRLSEIEASLGLSQLKLIDKFVRKRNSIASRYQKKLKNLPLQLPVESEEYFSAYHLFVIRFKIKISKTFIFDYFHKRKINLQVHYIPIHLQPYYKNMGFSVGDFPESENFYDEAISLPIFYQFSIQQQNYVIKCLNDIISLGR